MFTTVLILLVLSTNVIDGLSCISDGLIEISLNELTHAKFQDEMNYLLSSDHDDVSDDIILCGIIITVDYTTNELTIELDAGSASSNIGDINDSAILYTTFSRIPEQKHISELFILCSSEDNCDEKFLTMDNNYQWWWSIDEVNHTEIERMFMKLFIKEESTLGAVRCYHNSTIIPCSFEVCRLKVVDQSDLYQTCFTNTKKRMYLIIQTSIMIKSQTNQLKHTVEYTCQFDLCNDQYVLLQADNITDMHYNVSPMLRVFSRKTTIEPSTIPIITQPSSILTSIQSSYTSSSAESSSTSSSTSSPTQSSSTSIPGQPSTTPTPIQSSSTTIPMQSITGVNSIGGRLKVSIKLISLIFQIFAFLFL